MRAPWVLLMCGIPVHSMQYYSTSKCLLYRSKCVSVDCPLQRTAAADISIYDSHVV